jgi:hypothetical protein
MSTEQDTTRIVRSWLEDGVTALPERVLDAVLEQLPSTNQRRVPWGRPAFRRATTGRLGLAAAAMVIVALVAISLAPRDDVGGRPTSTPGTSPTSAPSPVLFTYAFDGFPVGVSFEAPRDWARCMDYPLEEAICRPTETAELAVSLLIVDNVVIDPCRADEALLDPPPGPSVDELVAAIVSLPGFTPSQVREIELDGYSGKEFTIFAPLGGSCDLKTWATAERVNGVSAGETNIVRILDVDGTRVTMTGAYRSAGRPSDDDIAEIEQVMDSVDFTP